MDNVDLNRGGLLLFMVDYDKNICRKYPRFYTAAISSVYMKCVYLLLDPIGAFVGIDPVFLNSLFKAALSSSLVGIAGKIP